MTKLSILSALIFSLGLALPVLAEDEINTAPGLTAAGAPLGLHGYDPVALQAGRHVAGSAEHTATHEGVAYYFTSARNLRRFRQSPARFTTQFGGFCAYGVSVGKKFDGDPRYSVVVEGRVYVFLNEEIMRTFQQDPAGNLARARTQWRTIEHRAASSL